MLAKKAVETPEKIALRHEREAKELTKLKKTQTKHAGKFYLIGLMVLLILIYIADEVSTNINLSMQSLILFDMFDITSRDATSPEYTSAINTLSSLNIFTYAFAFALPFYKALQDRFGRKPFLIINTVGMALGMLFIMAANNLIVYFIGIVIIAFVTPNDVQTLFIMENAPPQHRAKLCSIAKACAILGISTIGLMRSAMVTDDISSWRNVFIIPIIFTIVIAVVGLIFAKETPVYVEQRVAFLETTDDERATAAAAEKAAQQGGGVIKAIKFIARHKQIKYISIAGFLYIFSSIATSYYESIMSSGSMTEEMIATAIIFYPFSYAILTFIAGFISDKWGRKRVAQVFGGIAGVALVLFTLASRFFASGILVGVLYGCYVGGLWSASDTIFFTISEESVPTELRGSVVGVMFLISAIGTLFGLVLFTVLQNFLDIGLAGILISVPFLCISLFLLTFKVSETKDVDLNTVTGSEWDK